MKKLSWSILLVAIAISSCKEEEPFEFPEDPVEPKPQLIVEMQRVMKAAEDWTEDRQIAGCDPNIDDINLAIYEVNQGSGQALIQLVPSGEGCALSLNLRSAINANEISKSDWDELTYEFTYSEYGSTDGSKFFIELYYKELEFRLNLAPHISTLLGDDSTDGLLKMWFENGEPAFSLNGISFRPDFDSADNLFSMDGDQSENYVGFGISSDGSPEQSFVVSQFLRITRFGVKD